MKFGRCILSVVAILSSASPVVDGFSIPILVTRVVAPQKDTAAKGTRGTGNRAGNAPKKRVAPKKKKIAVKNASVALKKPSFGNQAAVAVAAAVNKAADKNANAQKAAAVVDKKKQPSVKPSSKKAAPAPRAPLFGKKDASPVAAKKATPKKPAPTKAATPTKKPLVAKKATAAPSKKQKPGKTITPAASTQLDSKVIRGGAVVAVVVFLLISLGSLSTTAPPRSLNLNSQSVVTSPRSADPIPLNRYKNADPIPMTTFMNADSIPASEYEAADLLPVTKVAPVRATGQTATAKRVSYADPRSPEAIERDAVAAQKRAKAAEYNKKLKQYETVKDANSAGSVAAQKQAKAAEYTKKLREFN